MMITRTNVDVETVVTWTAGSSPGAPDLVPSSGTVHFPAGQVSRQFTVGTVDDAAHTGDRSFGIWLSSATNDYLIEKYSSVGLHVRENDFDIVGFPAMEFTVREDSGIVAIAVHRKGVVSHRVTVWYEASGSGILSTRGELVFESGETVKTFPVAVIDDEVWTEYHQSALLDLRWPSSATIGGNSLFARAWLRIQEDEEVATLSVENIVVVEGDQGTTTATFTVRASKPVPPVSFYYYFTSPSTATPKKDFDDKDYSSFKFSDGVTEQTISLQIRGDTAIEGNEFFTIRIYRNSDSVFPSVSLFATCTIVDDEEFLEPRSIKMVRGGQAQLRASIGAPATAPVVVTVSTSQPTVVEVAEFFTVPAGQSTIVIPLTGLTAGVSELAVGLPNGESLTASIFVNDDGTAVFDPPHLTLFKGEAATVHVSLDPNSAEAQRLPLVSGNAKIATVQDGVEVPAGGKGSFVVKGIAVGGTTITATLPAQHSLFEAVLLVDVVERPETPALSSIAPPTGPSAGGTAFEARGAHLSANCTLTFGGVPATNIALNAEGALTGITPAHGAGVVDVVLRCGETQFVLTNAFTYIGSSPAISAFAPSFGSTAGGTLARAAVTNAHGGCWLFFGDTPAMEVWVQGPVEITATTPPRATAGTVAASIRCGEETATLPNAFTYSSAAEPSMSIISVSPLAGAPGEPVTITGSRFRPSDRVAFDETAATVLQTMPDMHIVRVPELPPGPAAIHLVDAEGRATTTGPIFTVGEAAPPYIASVAPSPVAAGAEVVLEGRGLRPGFTFLVNGLASRVVSLAFERAVLRLSGDIAPGTYPVDVRDAASRLVATGPTLTIVTDGVTLRSIAPACGTTDGGVVVTLTGSGFAPGATVTFDGVAAQNVEVVDESTIRATAPAGTAGLARVVVTNPNGDTDSLTDAFRFRSPFDPSSCSGNRSRSVRH